MVRGGPQTRSNNHANEGFNTANTFSVLEPHDRPPAEDPRSPYYISNGDHSIICLVPKKLSGCENYSSWRRSMVVALAARNKIKFVDGRLPPPDQDDEAFDDWFCCNSLVISWILHVVSSEIADSIMYLDNASRIWSELQERYYQKNAPLVFEAKRSLHSLAQGSQSVTSYFTKLKTIWDPIQDFQPQPLCTCGAMKTIQDYQDEDRVLEFLIGLNESYATARSQILLQDPFPNINKVFSAVVQEERQRGICSSNHEDEKSNVNLGSTSFSGSSHQQNCKPLQCSHCGMQGHMTTKCYCLHGYPPGHRLYGKPPPRKPPSKATVNFSIEGTPQASAATSNREEELLH